MQGQRRPEAHTVFDITSWIAASKINISHQPGDSSTLPYTVMFAIYSIFQNMLGDLENSLA